MSVKTQKIRQTKTLLPREALREVDRRVAIRESAALVLGSPSITQANAANAVNAVDQPVGVLDRTLPARVTARAVLASEFSAVREGIAIAANDQLEIAVRLGGVHRARRGLKRLQALRDLLQSGFVQGRNRAQVSIRRAKESLAEARQRDALASLLEELCALRGQPLTTPPVGSSQSSHLAPSAPSIAQALDATMLAERSMCLCSGASLDWHELTAQFSSTWRAARVLALRPWLGLGETDLHDARKKFQRIADQMAVMEGCITAQRYSARRRLRTAAENLGRARDLALLADKIEGTTAEGRALAKRALALRAKAVRRAREQSRLALNETPSSMLRAMRRRIARR